MEVGGSKLTSMDTSMGFGGSRFTSMEVSWKLSETLLPLWQPCNKQPSLIYFATSNEALFYL